jgi:hypothetical protein
MACGSSKEAAAKQLGNTAFNNIKAAYEYSDKICDDMIASYDFGQEINNGGKMDFQKYIDGLNLSEDEILGGVRAILEAGNVEEDMVDALTAKGAADSLGRLFILVVLGDMKDDEGGYSSDVDIDMRGLLIEVVDKSYEICGGYESAQDNLKLAKGALTSLSQEYSDSKYYTEVKDFYDYENDFLGFCDKIDRVYASNEEIINTLKDYKDSGKRTIDSLEITFAGEGN